MTVEEGEDEMQTEQPVLNAWSRCPHEIHNHTMDSTRWYAFRFRSDDIVIATWAKSGTTWLQQIIGQLIFGPVEGLPVFDYSPWIELRCTPKAEMLAMLEAQTHRRFVKTHLPADALVYSHSAKYIYIGRDGRDVVWSWYNHHRNLTPLMYDLLAGTPGLVGPPLRPPAPDVRQYFREWLERDGFPLWPFWSHVRSWWEIRDRPNVMLVHFADLKADLCREIQRIANFLSIQIDGAQYPTICRHCSFEYMKTHATTLSPGLAFALKGGASSFINRGVIGHWRGVLSDRDNEEYARRMSGELSPECATWLTHGTTPRSSPQPAPVASKYVAYR